MATIQKQIEVLVCTNDRRNIKESCADGDCQQILKQLQHEITKHHLEKSVKISDSGCLGMCEDGPNVLLWPIGKMFCKCEPTNVPSIVKEILQYTISTDDT